MEKEAQDNSTNEMIERAERAAEMLKAENERLEKNLARKALGGKTDAGEQPPIKKEETPAEYAKRIMQGKI